MIDMKKVWLGKAQELKNKAKIDFDNGCLNADTLEDAKRCEDSALLCAQNNGLSIWVEDNVLTSEMAAHIFGVSTRTIKRWYSGEKRTPETVLKMIDLIDRTNHLEVLLEGFIPRGLKNGR